MCRRRVGVRYCGGCNPRYDRKAAVERLAARYPLLRFCPMSEGEHWDGVLLVQGCAVGCAKPPQGTPPPPVYTLRGEEDPPALEELL